MLVDGTVHPQASASIVRPACALKSAATIYQGQLVPVFKRYMDVVDATLSIDTTAPQAIYGEHRFIQGFPSVDQSLFDSTRVTKDLDLSFVGPVAGWSEITSG